MPKAASTAAEIGAQVAREESHRAQLAPLLDVYEFVREQALVRLVTSTEENGPTDRHRRDARREERNDHEPGSRGIVSRHVGERRARRRREPHDRRSTDDEVDEAAGHEDDLAHLGAVQGGRHLDARRGLDLGRVG